jgi:hypothetical protein
VKGLAIEVLCWVCHRLAASVEKEAGEIALYWKGDDSDAAA